MPDKPDGTRRAHPIKRLTPRGGDTTGRRQARRYDYAELLCRSNFSFLRGGSHPEELVERAAELGYAAIAVTDRNTLAGVVRMHCAAKAYGLKLLVGAEVHPFEAPPIALYAIDRTGYGHLCRIITAGRRRSPKGSCEVTLADIAESSAGLIAVVHLSSLFSSPDVSADFCHPYGDIFGDRLYLAASVHGGPDDQRYLAEMDALARATGAPMVATNDVHYHEPGRRFLQDVLTCIRERCTLEEAGRRLFANAERHLKPLEEIERLFATYPHAIARTMEIADRCPFSLDELRYEYPESICPAGKSPATFLAGLTWTGARERYPDGIPGQVRRLIEHELKLIRQLAYEPYFLTVWDIVKFARSRGILCQGRGSAANSVVCYCLGVTSVDPGKIDLLFERFVSAERNEPPDIDVDFEHERREEVFQYIYQKFGREHAGIVAEVITYRTRSAVRDVGKALGLSLDRIDALAKGHEWWDKEALPEDVIREIGFDPADRTIRMLRRLVRQLVGFPRHLSQHVGGFVITRGPLCEMVPIENAAMPGRTFIEWDKDDIDALGILKIDCLALGMLTAIRKCFGLIEGKLRITNYGLRNEDGPRESTDKGPSFVIGNSSLVIPAPLALHTVPSEDLAVYDMIRQADTVGVFQIESRAQMSMLPRLKPRKFYDLVIEVAIVRPGPIQGGMVHPYLRRRNGEEPVTYPTEAIKKVLYKTLGVPLFQEQAMRLAVVAAGFTPGEADQLRRAMGAWRRSGDISRFRTKLLEGMKARGLTREFAERCFEQICGFGEYGFPESHAASFALLVYVSAWLKRYHPAAFCAALINSQPMGFYQPAQLVRDAREHGVTVLPIDVNFSGYDCRLEEDVKNLFQYRRSVAPRGLKPAARGGLETGSEPPGIHGGESAGRHPPSAVEPPARWGAGGPAVRLGMRLIKGISATQVEGIERAQREGPFTSVADLARRSGAPRATLLRLAAADALRSLGKPSAGAKEDVPQPITSPDSGGRLASLLTKGGDHARGTTPSPSLPRRGAAPRPLRPPGTDGSASRREIARNSSALNRRQALWQVLALRDELPLFEGFEPAEVDPQLPEMSIKDNVYADYGRMGLSLAAHPMSLIRSRLKGMGVSQARVLKHARQGQWLRVAGLVLVRQRPATARGIIFSTLEDETGTANLVIRPEIYDQHRRAARGAVALIAEGRAERQGEVVHLQTTRLQDLSTALLQLPSRSRDFH